MTGDAHHLPRSRRLSRARPATARCCATRGSRPRTSARGSRSRATTGSRPAGSGSGAPDYLYISHLHRDHFDPEWLARHVNKQARVLLPEFGDRSARTGAAVARLSRPRAHDARRARSTSTGSAVTILAMTSPADGPLGDSAIVLDDGSARVLNQNDARPGDLDALRGARAVRRAAPPVLRARSGIPIAYDFPPEEKDRLARSKRIDEMERAERYVEGGRRDARVPVRGTAVLPRPRPLRAQRPRPRSGQHLSRPDRVPRAARRARHRPRAARRPRLGDRPRRRRLHGRRIPEGADADARRSPTSARTCEQYRHDWARPARRGAGSRGRGRATTSSPSWRRGSSRCSTQAPITSAGIAGNVVIDVGDRRRQRVHRLRRVDGTAVAGEPYVYKLDVDRALVEALVDDHVEDWVNSLFLSCRFTAHRDGPFNEFVLTFFKALSPERIAYVEQQPRRGAAAHRRVLRTRRLAHRTLVPAPPGRPHPLRRDRRRRAHVQPPPLALRPRDRAVPHERRPPPPLRARDARLTHVRGSLRDRTIAWRSTMSDSA